MLTLGCHLSRRGGFLKMAEEAVSINANTFQYFTRNPRGGAQAELKEKDVEAFHTYAKEHDLKGAIAYAPYDADPATADQSRRDFALLVFSEDLARLEEFPDQSYLIRPGSATGQLSAHDGLQAVSDALNHVIQAGQSTRILLDTMAGEGSQVGRSFDQLAAIIDGVKQADRVGVCLDTAALWAEGLDIVNDLDGVLDQLDAKIGLDKVGAVHLNDATHDRGSHVDRHARIGEGKIGFEALSALTKSPRLAGVPFILEEPDSTLVIYEHDIARLRQAYRA